MGKYGNINLASNSMWLSATKLMTTLISLATTKVLSEKFSLGEYGTYAQIFLIISAVTSMTILGLTDGVNYFYNGCTNSAQQEKNVNTVFFLQALIGTAAGVLILLASDSITLYFGNPALDGIYIYIMFSPLLANLIAMYQVLFVSTGQSKLIAIRNLVISLCRLGAVMIAAFVTNRILSIFQVLLVLDIMQVVVYAVLFGRENFGVNIFAIDVSMCKKIFLYCAPLSVYILTNYITRDMDKYIITYFSDVESLAVYTNASKVLPFDILTTSLATVMAPLVTKFIAQKEYQKCRYLYKTYLEFSYVTTWILAVGAIVCAKELMLLLYSDKYLSGLSIFIVYIMVDMIRFANVAVILRAKGKTKDLMYYSMGMLVANFILNILFYQFFGMVGPAIATLLVTAVMNVCMLKQGANIMHCTIFDLFEGRRFSLFLLELLGAGAIAYGIKWILTGWNLHYIAILFITYGCFGLMLLPLNGKNVLVSFKNMNTIKE